MKRINEAKKYIPPKKKPIGKEMSISDSNKSAKELMRQKKYLVRNDWTPGNTIFLGYDAKDKTQTYDKTPLVMILKRNKRHTLGLNFHWLPYVMRQSLIINILKMNMDNINKGKPIEFSYEDLKPFLKRYGYAPCIRLYINSRLTKQGSVIPPSKLPAAARMRTETFSQGKYTSQQIWKQVHKNAKKANKKPKKRSSKK